MSKGPRRSRETRWSSTQSLDHTVSTPERRRPLDTTVRSTLMRTVLGDSDLVRGQPSSTFPASQKRTRSPTVVVRASGRSSQKQVLSPFRNATLFTPEVSHRAMECARRHIRKEVLFAKKGLNGSSPKRRRSKTRC